MIDQQSTPAVLVPADDREHGAEGKQAEDETAQDDGVRAEEDLLVEEISIDGMCGVY